MGLLAATVAMTVAGCGSRGDSYRQRITVEVETPEGLKTGSSVSEIKWSYRDGFGEQGGSRASARGEAVAVDLPGGQTLFALVTSETDPDWLATAAARAVGDQVPPERQGKGGYFEDHHLKGDLKPEDYPRLVRFGDMNDPATVQEVDPINLRTQLGAGVRLSRITLAITDDPVTDQLRKHLPWSSSQAGSLVKQTGGKDIGDLPLAGRLNDGDFLRRGAR